MRLPRHFNRPLLLDGLEPRQLLAAPTISLSDTFTVPIGKTLQVPIAGEDADGDTLSYSVSTGSGVSAGFRASTNTFVELYTNKGTMRFQLFDDLAPNTVRKIRGLVESGFYDNLNFHYLQTKTYRFAMGGDPNGNGTGGPQFRFDDEFNKDAIFSGSGQLAMNNGEVKDNNGSQFFITDSQARAYDFNYTIFGQLVRGGKVLDNVLNATPAVGFGTPTTPVTIQSARIVESKTDAVMQLRGGSAGKSTTVTVTASDGRNVVSKTVTVNVVADASNTPPILQAIPRVITAVPGERFFVQVEALDLENDPWDIRGNILSGGEGLAYQQLDQTNKRLIFEVQEGYAGPIKIKVGVRMINTDFRGSIVKKPGEPESSLRIYDTQEFTIAAGARPIDGSAYTVASYPQIQLANKLVARFVSQDAQLEKADFDASVDWGDGIVSQNATIQEISNNVFGVFGTHTYSKTGTRPLSVTIDCVSGATQTVSSNVYVNNPYTLVGKTLYIRGTDEADEVNLDVNGGALDLLIGGYEKRFDLTTIGSLDVQLFDGDDKLDSGTSVGMPNQRVDAGPGNDTIMAGSGHDSIIGLAGNDFLAGNGGNDTIIGGDGDDSIQSGSGKNYAYGDAGSDRIVGSGGRDIFDGGADSDRIYGRGGDDYLDGGSGTDRLYGEDGSDTLIGGASNDRIYGGVGDDLFIGKQGVDYLFGNGGIDRRGDDDERDVLTDVI
jgi:cyclophilin family peptidyl-prolyl cis-trans isomerase